MILNAATIICLCIHLFVIFAFTLPRQSLSLSHSVFFSFCSYHLSLCQWWANNVCVKSCLTPLQHLEKVLLFLNGMLTKRKILEALLAGIMFQLQTLKDHRPQLFWLSSYPMQFYFKVELASFSFKPPACMVLVSCKPYYRTIECNFYDLHGTHRRQYFKRTRRQLKKRCSLQSQEL